jgi:hypothetical protein
MAALSGDNSLARVMSCSAAGAEGAARPFLKLKAAAVAKELASERAASARTAWSRQAWNLWASELEYACGTAIAAAAAKSHNARARSKNLNGRLTMSQTSR